MAQASPRFAQETRLRFLDGLFFWDGQANRRDLMAAFHVSQPQAALDLKAYLNQAAPGQVTYDARRKRYEATEAFRPLYGAPQIEPWLERARNQGVPAEVLPTLDRPLDAALMARLYRAIRDRRPLGVQYQTMSRPDPETRTITPTAFACDGQRWHVRAYCHLREAYRDFVLSRLTIVDHSLSMASAGPLIRDLAWETYVELVLTPAPSLEPSQAQAVARDYGMGAEGLLVRVRLALEFYALRRWGLDQPQSRLIVQSRRELAPAPPEGGGPS